MTSRRIGSIVLIAMAVLGCNREKPAPAAEKEKPAPAAEKTAAAPPPWTITVQPLVTPAVAGSSGPQLSVSEKGGPLLSWIETADGKATLKFAERNALG